MVARADRLRHERIERHERAIPKNVTFMKKRFPRASGRECHGRHATNMMGRRCPSPSSDCTSTTGAASCAIARSSAAWPDAAARLASPVNEVAAREESR